MQGMHYLIISWISWNQPVRKTILIIFPYHLSEDQAVAILLVDIIDIETLAKGIDDWLWYFPQAKPHMKGVTPLMIVLSFPFQIY